MLSVARTTRQPVRFMESNARGLKTPNPVGVTCPQWSSLQDVGVKNGPGRDLFLDGLRLPNPARCDS